MLRAAALVLAVLLTAVLAVDTEAGGAYSYSDEKEVIGISGTYRVGADESLHETALRFELGYNDIADANPSIDPWVPGEGTEVVIPTSWVLPHAEPEGIVVNLAEMRLYHFFKIGDNSFVKTYPVGIGRQGFEAPFGDFTIMEKLERPAWVVPESVREENPGLPKVVPTGDENPLGDYALRLSDPAYLIHGTNRPFGIGRRVSHGCIRMYPEGIKELFNSVHEGARVNFVYQPLKLGVKDGTVYGEAHRDYLGRTERPLEEAWKRLKDMGLVGRVDAKTLYRVLEEARGVPVPLGP